MDWNHGIQGFISTYVLSDCFPEKLFLSPMSSPSLGIYHSNICYSEGVKGVISLLF